MEWITDLASPYLEGPILELGAGHGTFTPALATFGSVVAVEPDGVASQILASRFANDPNVTVCPGVVEDLAADANFGSAVMINVLEHIPGEASALDSLHRQLRPGGHLIIWVPAFELLFSNFDKKLGHQRRYTRAGLEKVVAEAGFTIVEAKYVNCLGFFTWLILVRFLKTEPTKPVMISIFDRLLVPVLRRIERWIEPPFGQSVFLVARKPFVATRSA
jgi:SAM-dependent methyltransferase